MLNTGKKGELECVKGIEEKQVFLQCTDCGKIYRAIRNASVEQLYINNECPSCGHYRAINLGPNQDDIYLYYDVSLDERYFIYK